MIGWCSGRLVCRLFGSFGSVTRSAGRIRVVGGPFVVVDVEVGASLVAEPVEVVVEPFAGALDGAPVDVMLVGDVPAVGIGTVWSPFELSPLEQAPSASVATTMIEKAGWGSLHDNSSRRCAGAQPKVGRRRSVAIAITASTSNSSR